MKNRKIINMRDIAAKTGVSMTTVSRVMSKQGNFSQETRDRILKVAHELGYYDNRLSSAIRLGKTGTVGVLIDIHCTFFRNIFKGIYKALVERDYLPIIGIDENNDSAMIHRLIEQRVDGIIIVPTEDKADNQFYSEVINCGIPMIALDREVPADIDFIGTDDYEGSRRVAEYLYLHGHRNLAYYQGPEFSSPGRLRRTGFADFCNARPDMTLTVLGNEDGQFESREALIAFLRNHPDVTAISCFSDYHARQMQTVAATADLPRMPLFCGFGNVAAELPGTCPILTVDQQPEKLGTFAVERLFRRMEQHDLPPEKFRFVPDFPRLSEISAIDREICRETDSKISIKESI